jgi:E3 ubiquitin-protein ligase SIAH1
MMVNMWLEIVILFKESLLFILNALMSYLNSMRLRSLTKKSLYFILFQQMVQRLIWLFSFVVAIQCDNGHIVCSTCCPKLKNKCLKCSFRISSKRCKVIDNLLSSIEMPCRNAKHGCREKIRYIGNRKHEEECIHEPCYCPFSSCDFVASSEVLSNHLSLKHGDSLLEFCYGNSFIVSLKSNDETIVLQEENDDKLFILNNSTMILGNVVNICCIGPNSSGSEYNYDILHKSHICKLTLHSWVKNVQRVTSGTLSSEFLVIPVGSSEPLELEICITAMVSPISFYLLWYFLSN